MSAGLVAKLAGASHGSCLIVVTSKASCSIVMSCFPDRSPLGTIVLPEVAMKGNAVQSSLTDKSCALFACGEHGQIILCICLYDLKKERCSALASSLYEIGLPIQQVLVVGSMASDELRGALADEADPSEGPLLFLLSTLQAREKREGQPEPTLPFLPSGSIVGGLPAAIVSAAQARGLPADLILHVEMVPSLAPLAVRPLAASMHKMLSSSEYPESVLAPLSREDFIQRALKSMEVYVGIKGQNSVYS